jgi:alanyl-tRNA synthetase
MQRSTTSVELFDREGFTRHTCKFCGKNFWATKETESCGDSSHTEYSFFKDKPKASESTWTSGRSLPHSSRRTATTEVEKYPVVSRWRQDLYFTIAGIQDFQRIENGKMSFEYPANPLVVPQVCLRFSDIENVGVTGRHFTSFMMANQTAFDYPKAGYWRDRTIDLNFNYLTTILGVKKDDLIYGEDVWAMGDFSEFGPSLESFANGSELVNSVFTQFEYVNGNIQRTRWKGG